MNNDLISQIRNRFQSLQPRQHESISDLFTYTNADEKYNLGPSRNQDLHKALATCLCRACDASNDAGYRLQMIHMFRDLIFMFASNDMNLHYDILNEWNGIYSQANQSVDAVLYIPSVDQEAKELHINPLLQEPTSSIHHVDQSVNENTSVNTLDTTLSPEEMKSLRQMYPSNYERLSSDDED